MTTRPAALGLTRIRPPRRAALGAGLASLLMMSCSGAPARTVLSDAELHARATADTQEMVSTVQESVGRLLTRMEAKVAGPEGDQATLNLLAMSGGGDYGAFGAGFLVGWGQAAEAGMRRPDFDAVTGVSTGAMLAPFAFVGTDEACLAVEEFYRHPKKDWVKDRGLFFFMPSNPSFMTIPGLERDLATAIDATFVKRMADESAKGKLLAVSATDLDLGRQRFWDLGTIAQKADASGDTASVRAIMLASAAIPAVFPPIGVGDEIYCDGGVTANVFLRLDPRNPYAFLPRWRAAHPGKPLPKIRYWVIINNQLNHAPKTIQQKWGPIAGVALETAIRSATITEVKLLAAEADYVNAVYGTDIEVRVVGIPDDWRPPVEGDFKQETMDSLAALGRKMGADPASWKVWARPAAK